MATILGLSSFYHDSAAALIRDGLVVAAAQEERFTRQKADPSFPCQSISNCLETAGISHSDIDAVAFYEIPSLKFDRLIETFMAGAPRGFNAFRAAMPNWLSTKLRVRDHVEKQVGKKLASRLHYCPHHLSHAASAFYPSPFDTAAILTIDGVGEWATATIMQGSGRQLQPLVEQRFPHSLGLLYSAVTTYCGFEINTGEFKLMGLAAEGRPRWVERLMNTVVHIAADGSIRLNQRYFNYCYGFRMTAPAFHELFGRKPRQASEPIEELHCDLAASVQAITEMSITLMAKHAIELTGQRKLCLAGGVALNCVAVGRVMECGMLDDIWVQPAAGDAGGAVGAALWLSHSQYQVDRTTSSQDSFRGAFLGPTFNEVEAGEAILQRGLQSQRYEDDDSLCKRIAAMLADGKVVGWMQGAMEFGPRALGHRSILADPRDPGMKDHVNHLIKHRESFRPFAPSVLKGRFDEFFTAQAGQTLDYPYMTQAFRVAQPLLIPAVTHCDGTARVQTVDRARNPKFARLLEAFDAITGIPVLLNTSFNDRDEPIVCTPRDAVSCFLSTDIDVLVIGNHVVCKPTGEVTIPMTDRVEKASIEPRWLPASLFVQALAGAALLTWQVDGWLGVLWAVAMTLIAIFYLTWRPARPMIWHGVQWSTYPLRWLAAVICLGTVYFGLLTPIGWYRKRRGHRPLDQAGWLPFTSGAALAMRLEDQQTIDYGSLPWWRELLSFLREEKKWWLVPIAVSLAVIAFAATVGGAVAPWIYTLW